jgi:thiol-disulfide isomerase/thioredoxin
MVASVTKVLSAVLLLETGCATAGPAPAGQDGLASPTGAEPEVRLLDGSLARWSSLLAAQGETLVVFATLWCEICRRERPTVEAWARAHQGSQRSIYVFSGGELPTAVDQIRALHLDTTALTVVVDADGRLADHYAVEATPTLLLLGAQGRVLSVQHRFKALNLN